MKFVSARSDNGEHLEFSLPFCGDFASVLDTLQNGWVVLKYDTSSLQSYIPYRTSRIYLAILPTTDEMIVTANTPVEYESSDGDTLCESYGDLYDGIDFGVRISSNEFRKISLFLLKNFYKNSATG